MLHKLLKLFEINIKKIQMGFQKAFAEVFHQTSSKKQNFGVGILQKKSACKQNVVYLIGNYGKQSLRVSD